MHPKCIVTVNGTPVAGAFFEKLIRLSVHDHEGGKADTVDMHLEDGPPFLEIPRKDDEIKVWLGYLDGVPPDYMGAFKVDDVDCQCLPWSLTIKGKSADLRSTMKQHRSRHWDNTTLGDVVRTMAHEHGLTPQIDSEFANHIPENGWLGQINESNLHFLQTHAERHGCIFSIKDDKLIVAKRGAGTTPSGAAIAVLTVLPTMVVKNTLHVHWGQRERHKKVRAHHHNRKTGKREHVDEDTGDTSADSTYTMRHSFSGKTEARRAARGRAKFLKGGGVRTSVTIEGDPTVKAGRPLTYTGIRPAVDGLEFVIESAIHSFSKSSGYRVEIRGKLKDGADATKDGAPGTASNSSPSATAPSNSAGTPSGSNIA